MLILILATALGGLLICGFCYEEYARKRDAVQFPSIGRLVDIGGRRLHLLSKGSKGPTVVIEQGAGGPSLAWVGVQSEASKFARICIYDRAGYQWSDPASAPRSLEDRVKDLHALLAAASIPGPYILVAHSYGGFLIRLFTRQYPASVAGLVFVDAGHEYTYFQSDVLSMQSKVRWALRLMGLASRLGVPRLATYLFVKPDQNIPHEIGRQMNAGMVRREYFAAASDDIGSLLREARWLSEPGAFGGLGDLPISVVTHGQPFPGPFAVLEKSWAQGQEKLVNLSSSNDFFIAEHSNHMIQNDQPEIVVEAIRSVVSRVKSRAPISAPQG